MPYSNLMKWFLCLIYFLSPSEKNVFVSEPEMGYIFIEENICIGSNEIRLGRKKKFVLKKLAN